MTVLSANPLTAEPADIGEIKAISTWLAGKPSDARTWRRAHLSRAIDILGRLLTR